jgi:hypothetical protein
MLIKITLIDGTTEHINTSYVIRMYFTYNGGDVDKRFIELSLHQDGIQLEVSQTEYYRLVALLTSMKQL